MILLDLRMIMEGLSPMQNDPTFPIVVNLVPLISMDILLNSV